MWSGSAAGVLFHLLSQHEQGCAKVLFLSLGLLQLVNYEQTWLRSSVCMACISRLSDAQVAIASISFVLYVPNWRITILTSIMSKPKYSPMLIS
jgi:hypothetical protein